MKKWHKALLSIAALLTLTACGSQSDATDSAGANSTVSSSEKEKTVSVEDARGTVEVPLNPQNVAVFDFGHLDTIRALGKEESVTGTVTENMPVYLSDLSTQYENVGTLKEPNVETLAILAPDLIIISNRMADFAEQLEEIAPVLVLSVDYADYWGSVQNNIGILGTVFDAEAEAKASLDSLEEEMTEMNTKATQTADKALAVLLSDGSISAFGSGSRFGFIYDTLGVTPVDATIEASTHGQTIGYEGIMEINPDILFVVDRTAAIGTASSENASLLENDFIYQTEAYKKEQIINLSADLWYLSGGGIESVHLMIEEISQHF